MNKGKGNTNFLILLFMVVALGEILQGCVTKQPFEYNYANIETTSSPKFIVISSLISDQRSDRDIDEHFKVSVIHEVHQVLQNELKNTGLFLLFLSPETAEEPEKTVLLPTGDTVVLEVTLLDLRWEVPSYIAIKTTSLVIGFIATGVGAILYGGTDAEVNGHAEIHVKMTNAQTKEVLVESTYKGMVTETKTKLDCDTSETRVEIVIKALEDLMVKLRSDLVRKFR